MAPAPPAPSHRTALTTSSYGGTSIEFNREEQGHSLLFQPRNCQASTSPQLATDPFLPASLRHTPLCQRLVEREKVGVAWDLSFAVPKPAKLERIKLVTIRPWKHLHTITGAKHEQRNACFVSKYRLSLKPIIELNLFTAGLLNTAYFQNR